jgi:hypothetical protein
MHRAGNFSSQGRFTESLPCTVLSLNRGGSPTVYPVLYFTLYGTFSQQGMFTDSLPGTRYGPFPQQGRLYVPGG